MSNNLAERDKNLNKIENELLNRKKMLLDNYNKHEEDPEEIQQEYADYFHKELKICEMQLEKLNNLLMQNDSLALDIKDNATLLKEFKKDQKDIMHEILKLEKKFNSLMNI